MRTATCTKTALDRRIQELTEEIEEPLYRAIWTSDYSNTKNLEPQSGSYSVGKGGFFTNNPQYAKSFLGHTLLITSRQKMDPENNAIDTRGNGYDRKIRAELDQRLGTKNYNGFTLWDEITKHDTITYEGGSKNTYVYSKRMPVTQDELIAVIRITD